MLGLGRLRRGPRGRVSASKFSDSGVVTRWDVKPLADAVYQVAADLH